MHFLTALVPALALTLPLAAVASPIQESDDVVWADFSDIQARGELNARQGITCALGGNPACIARVQIVSHLLVETSLALAC